MSTGQAVGAVVGGAIGFVATGGNPYGAYIGTDFPSAMGKLIDPQQGDELKTKSAGLEEDQE